MKEIYLKYKEMIHYLIFGVLTTLTNIVVYYICHQWLSMNYMISNFFAWVFSVLFAYVTNRKYVFESKSDHVFKEMVSFFASRISTGVLDMGLMYLLIDVLCVYDVVAKVASNVVVIIANYVLSKLFVFKEGKA